MLPEYNKENKLQQRISHHEIDNQSLRSQVALGFDINPTQQRRLRRKTPSKQALRAVFWVFVFYLFEGQHVLESTKNISMVLSLSTSTMTRAPKLPLIRNAIPRIQSFVRLNSNMENFFESGGDMDRLVDELSAQRQNSTSYVSAYADKNGWCNGNTLHLTEDKKNKAFSPSPVEVRTIRDRTVYVKHDDQLKLSGSGISGNKARKMWTLNEIPAEKFPPCLVSYGGPQSNSMLALAAIANFKSRQLVDSSNDALGDELFLDSNTEEDKYDSNEIGVDSDLTDDQRRTIRFVYYTKKLPRFLRKQPNGNFFRALSLGMELVEVSREEYRDLFEHRSDDFEGAEAPPMKLKAPVSGSLFVPQGGAFALARVGAQKLAQEIYDFWSNDGNDRPLTVCVPGGTCTTALLLHHELKHLLSNLNSGKDGSDGVDDADFSNEFSSNTVMDIEVVVIPCVGDSAYARRQMMSLATQIGAIPEDIPTILQPEPDAGYSEDITSRLKRQRYFTFGKPDKTVLDTFQELRDDYNLLVDLIYGAPSFSILWRHWGKGGGRETLSPDLFFDPNQPLAGREIMYVHSGGLEGINSQLLRYKYDGLVEIKDIQLPGRRNSTRNRRRSKKKNQ